jgi:regulator of RNase E activity RraA
VFPGNAIVGDGGGLAVIPAEIADGTAKDAHKMTAFEDPAAERFDAGRSIIGLSPPTDDRNH